MSARLAPEMALGPTNHPPGMNRNALALHLGTLTLLCIVSSWVLFYGLGNFPLFNPDEALYAEPAREMLETHDYVTTTLNYAVRFTKPPVSIWAMALAMKLFGVNEFSARFFGAAAAVALIAGLYCFLTRYVSNRSAVIGAATLLVAPLFVGTARESITDMYLTAALAGAMLCFYRAYKDRALSWLWIAYVLVGISVMTKGPVGLVLPVAILLAYHCLRGNLRDAFLFYKPQVGALIVGAVVLPWFVTEIAITKGAYFNDFIMRENVQRYTSVVDKHKGGWWYHLAAMSAGYFPWIAFIPQAVATAVFPHTKEPPLNVAFTAKAKAWLGRYRDLTGLEDLSFFATCFIAVTLVFFSASVSKLLPYTVPAFPALAILVAIELERIFEQGRIRRLLLPLGLLAIVYGAAGQFGSFITTRVRHVPAGLWPIANSYIAFQSLLTGATLLLSLIRRPVAAVSIFAALTLCCTGYFGYRALSLLSAEWEGPIPALSYYAGQSGEPIFVYQARLPTVPFYARRATALSPNQENLTTTMEAELAKVPRAYIIAKATEQNHFQQTSGYRVVLKQDNYILVHWDQP